MVNGATFHTMMLSVRFAHVHFNLVHLVQKDLGDVIQQSYLVRKEHFG